jgi:pimeloyl-ACP methyl ester carboxylesterase
MIPGAGYGRGYFDIQAAGFEGYSEASYHTAQGFVVVAIDPLGAGESSLPEDAALVFPIGKVSNHRFDSNGTFSLEMTAAACDATVRDIRQRLRDGSLHPEIPPMSFPTAVGVGQSMGGFVVVAAQAMCQTFEAIGILGSSFTQTRLALLPGHRYPGRYVEPATLMRKAQTDTDLAASFHWADEPKALVAADLNVTNLAPWRSAAIPGLATKLMLPAILAREAAAVRTPVLLAYGEVDVTLEPLADAAMFRSTSDLTLLIVPQMAHMHNFAPTREKLWRRLEQFAGTERLCPDTLGGNHA